MSDGLSAPRHTPAFLTARRVLIIGLLALFALTRIDAYRDRRLNAPSTADVQQVERREKMFTILAIAFGAVAIALAGVAIVANRKAARAGDATHG